MGNLTSSMITLNRIANGIHLMRIHLKDQTPVGDNSREIMTTIAYDLDDYIEAIYHLAS